MIKAIVLDFGEVLYGGLYGAEKYIQAAVGVTVKNKQLQTPELGRFFIGAISENELWESMIAKFRWRTSVDALKAAVRKNFVAIDDTWKLLPKLRARRYRLGLLSVHGQEWIDYIEKQHRFRRLFDCVHFSCETQIAKPHSDAFLAISNGLEMTPSECLFVDDYDVNTSTAIDLGFHAHLFTGADHLRSELIRLKLLPN